MSHSPGTEDSAFHVEFCVGVLSESPCRITQLVYPTRIPAERLRQTSDGVALERGGQIVRYLSNFLCGGNNRP